MHAYHLLFIVIKWDSEGRTRVSALFLFLFMNTIFIFPIVTEVGWRVAPNRLRLCVYHQNLWLWTYLKKDCVYHQNLWLWTYLKKDSLQMKLN